MYYRDKDGKKIDNKHIKENYVKENYTHKDIKIKLISAFLMLVLSYITINILLKKLELDNDLLRFLLPITLAIIIGFLI